MVRDDKTEESIDRSRRQFLGASALGLCGAAAGAVGPGAAADGRRGALSTSDPPDDEDCENCCPVSPSVEPFGATDGEIAELANVFWTIYGVAETERLEIVGSEQQNSVTDLEPDHTIGQSFAVDESFTAVGGKLATYGEPDSDVTVSLYRDGPDGELLERERFTDVEDNGWHHLEFEREYSEGTYFLQASEPSGPVAWWSHTEDVYPDGRAFVDGDPAAGDRTIQIVVSGDLSRGDIYGARTGNNPSWNEWSSLQLAWTDRGGYRSDFMEFLESDTKINGVNASGDRSDGYVWSWTTSETWPDGDPAAGKPASYHFEQIPRFVAAVRDLYMWTRDDEFLETMLPRAETVMEDYLFDVMDGDVGVPIIPSEAPNGTRNDGTAESRPSTYMDQLRSGHKDAWVDAAAYTALQGMAELEDVAGNDEKRETYRSLAEAYPERYDEAFWSGDTQRYVGWIDVEGRAHDSGYTYINLEALARGLGDGEKAARVFEWLDEPAAPIEFGPHTGSTDVYHNVIAPRSNTEVVPHSDWDGWSDPPGGRKPYGDVVQNGGTLLWVAYYDIMARLEHRDADDALEKFVAMLDRMETESHCLTFSPRTGRFFNDFGESLVQIGTNEPFPESGIATLPFLYGFIGATAGPDGLTVCPSLPLAFVSATADGVSYAGGELTIDVSRGELLAEQRADGESWRELESGTELAQTFQLREPFDEVGLFVDAPQKGAFSVAVETKRRGEWVTIGTHRFADVDRDGWIHVPFSDTTPVPTNSRPDSPPTDEPGTDPGTEAMQHYRVRLYDPSGTVRWRESNEDLPGASATRNGTRLEGGFAVRAIDTGQEATIDQSDADTVDWLEESLGQTFTSPTPFDRVSLGAAARSSDAGFTATLYREVGGDWTERQSQTFPNVADGSEVTMSFATQDPGTYRLEIDEGVGSVGWPRSEGGSDSDAAGRASADGDPVAGDRWFRVYRGTYGIEIPQRGVDTTIDTGDEYTIPPN